MKIDSFEMHDEVELRHDGKRIRASEDGINMAGDVVILGRDKRGNVMFTRTEHNAILVNGSSYLLEKANNMRCRFAPPPLDVIYGSHTQSQVEVTKETLLQEYVCGMVFGIGGCTNTYNTVRPVSRNALTVPEMIPIRVVPAAEDFIGEERAKYFLRKTTYIGGVEYAMYYGKVFDTEPRIDIVFESGDDIPTDVYKYDNPGFIFSYTEYVLTVDADDIREYFKLNDGNTSMSRINTLGLVAGYPKVNTLGNIEFYNIRCLTTVNFENLELKDQLSTIEVFYRWHCR